MDLALSLVEGLDSEALGMLFTTTKPALQVCIFVCCHTIQSGIKFFHV
jgi:hypothetical protein